MVVHHRATGAGDGERDAAYACGLRVRREQLTEVRRHRLGVRLALPGDVEIGHQTPVWHVGGESRDRVERGRQRRDVDAGGDDSSVAARFAVHRRDEPATSDIGRGHVGEPTIAVVAPGQHLQ